MMVRALLLLLALAASFAAEAGTPPITQGELTTRVATLVQADSTIDLTQLEAALRDINKSVAAARVMPQPKEDAKAASKEAVTGTGGWRLWVFWAMDVPESTGLAAELVRVRGSGLASIRPVHLASLRQVEGWLFRMNDYREELLAAIQTKDVPRIRDLERTWTGEIAEFQAMNKAVNGGGVMLKSETARAEVLKVEEVPCFRLISPGGRVHSLSGFTPGVDLLAWVERCQAWEAQQIEGGKLK